MLRVQLINRERNSRRLMRNTRATLRASPGLALNHAAMGSIKGLFCRLAEEWVNYILYSHRSLSHCTEAASLLPRVRNNNNYKQKADSSTRGPSAGL